MTNYSSGAFDAEEANHFITELKEFLSKLPNLQIKDLQLIGMKSENICLKLPMLEQHLRIKNNCYRCLKQDRDADKLKQKRVNYYSGLNPEAGETSTVRSDLKIKDINFIQKCLKQIEALEQANAKLKRTIKL